MILFAIVTISLQACILVCNVVVLYLARLCTRCIYARVLECIQNSDLHACCLLILCACNTSKRSSSSSLCFSLFLSLSLSLSPCLSLIHTHTYTLHTNAHTLSLSLSLSLSCSLSLSLSLSLFLVCSPAKATKYRRHFPMFPPCPRLTSVIAARRCEVWCSILHTVCVCTCTRMHLFAKVDMFKMTSRCWDFAVVQRTYIDADKDLQFGILSYRCL